MKLYEKVSGHKGPDALLQIRSCSQNTCVTGGTPLDNWLASTTKREPCEDCKADGTWVLKAGSTNT